MTKVKLVMDDVDRHGEGCDCNQCNMVGKSFGVAIVPASASLKDQDYVDQLLEKRVYAPSEKIAFYNAKMLCKEKGYLIVEENEEGETNE